VDPKARREFWDQIHQLADQGITVLVSTHYMDEAERCHALVYIAYGNVLAQGTAASIVTSAGATDLEDAFVRLVGQAKDNFL
jgi:ABC-2 type transport system ATP-binding protein